MLPYWITSRPPKHRKPSRKIDMLDYDLSTGLHEEARHPVIPNHFYPIFDPDENVAVNDDSISGEHAVIIKALHLGFQNNKEYLEALQAYIEIKQRNGTSPEEIVEKIIPNDTQLLGKDRVLYTRPPLPLPEEIIENVLSYCRRGLGLKKYNSSLEATLTLLDKMEKRRKKRN